MIIRFLTFSREISLVSVAVVIQRWWRNSSLAEFVNLNHALTVFLKTRRVRVEIRALFLLKEVGLWAAYPRCIDCRNDIKFYTDVSGGAANFCHL